MCYFLKSFEYFSCIKIKISTTLKKKYNCNKLPWTKTQNKSIWVQQLTFRISQKISVWKFWKFNFITHEIENRTSKDAWTWWSVWQILCWNTLYIQHLCRIVWQVHETYGKFLLFHVSDNGPLNWNDAESSVQFLKGVPVDNGMYFDHLHHLTKIMESPLNYQDFTSFLGHQK